MNENITKGATQDGRQPGWHRTPIYVDDELIGHVDRHETASAVRWYAANTRWDPVGPSREQGGFGDEQSAVDAAVAHHERATTHTTPEGGTDD